MGQISFEEASKSIDSTTNGNIKVGFFALKNDGDEAVVRFMHDSTDTFDIVAVHPIQLDGKFRKVNCIRDARDPINKCPLCENGTKLENKFFIHLIQYDRDQSGNIVPSAKVWERSLKYARDLATLINEYGPLSDCIFKVKRCGASGSMDTTYQIMYASPQVYRPELYPKRPELFEGFKVIGTVVMDKTFAEISEYVNTGKFPTKQQNNANDVAPSYTPAPATQAAPQQNYTGGYTTPTTTPYPPQQTYPNPQSTPVQQSQTQPLNNNLAPWETSTPVMQRPIRTY